MGKIHAKQFALLERRVKAARLWRLGYSVDQIAEQLGVCHGTAWNDIQDGRIKADLLEINTHQEKRATGWAEQEIYKHEALQEWERSKTEIVEVTETIDPETGEVTSRKVKRTGRLGDPRYLAAAQAAERRQAEIYGTDVDTKRIDLFSGEEGDGDGGTTYRGTVPGGADGRPMADAVRGSTRVEIEQRKPVEEKADKVAVRQARTSVRRTPKNKGVRRGSRVRKK